MPKNRSLHPRKIKERNPFSFSHQDTYYEVQNCVANDTEQTYSTNRTSKNDT